MYLVDAKHVIKHSWRLHTLGVALTTTLVDSKSHRAKNSKMTYVENSHLALSLKGEEMTERILSNTRERGRSRRRNADSGIFCPIITALRGRRMIRSGKVTNQPADQELRCTETLYFSFALPLPPPRPLCERGEGGTRAKRARGNISRLGLRTASGTCTWSSSASTRFTGSARSWRV